MWTVEYLCRYRPVWYEAGDYYSLAAAIAAAVQLLQKTGRPVQVRDEAGLVRFSVP